MTDNQVEMPEPPFTPREFRNAMGQFASGVVVISAKSPDGITHAMTANAFMSGSLTPPLIVVSIAVTARMHDWIQNAGRFGVSILTHHQEKVSNHFAGKPTHDHAPVFEDLEGVPVIQGAAVRLAMDLQHSYDCGDHTLFVGHVLAMSNMDPEYVRPLLFYSGRYGNLAPNDWSAGSAPAYMWTEHGPSW